MESHVMGIHGPWYAMFFGQKLTDSQAAATCEQSWDRGPCFQDVSDLSSAAKLLLCIGCSWRVPPQQLKQEMMERWNKWQEELNHEDLSATWFVLCSNSFWCFLLLSSFIYPCLFFGLFPFSFYLFFLLYYCGDFPFLFLKHP